MKCSNCNQHSGTDYTLRLDGRDGPKTLDIRLCDACLEELLAEEWIQPVVETPPRPEERQ